MIYKLSFPVIVKYPWSSNEREQTDKSTTVIFAGSFNPPHMGHLGMLVYLARRYGEVIVVVGMNPNKVYDVSPADRAVLIERMMEKEGIPNVRVEVVSGYIWRYAMSQNTKIMFRGIRSWDKDGMDETLLYCQNLWGPMVLGLKWPLPTYFIEGDPSYRHVSSTFIRKLCHEQKHKSSHDIDLSAVVLKSIQKDVFKLYSSQ